MTDESIVSEVPSTEEIAQHYSAMGDSVDLINAVIAGTQMASESDEEKKGCVKRNVDHLEIMLAKDFWTDQDMTAVNAAVTSGGAYIV